ncbi:unnamed protein product [Cochlearia groenlandica]
MDEPSPTLSSPTLTISQCVTMKFNDKNYLSRKLQFLNSHMLYGYVICDLPRSSSTTTVTNGGQKLKPTTQTFLNGSTSAVMWCLMKPDPLTQRVTKDLGQLLQLLCYQLGTQDTSQKNLLKPLKQNLKKESLAYLLNTYQQHEFKHQKHHLFMFNLRNLSKKHEPNQRKYSKLNYQQRTLTQ